MIEKKDVTIANFNCTFKAEGKIHPLLDYFIEQVYPAFLDKNLSRIVTKKNDKKRYYLTDVQIIEVDDELILVGKHVKRVILQIKQDYDKDKGFIPVGADVPSAPFSTFMLLLKNHRLIYFTDQNGSPNIRSFAATANNILIQYRNAQYNNCINYLKDNDFIIDGIKYKSEKAFREQYFDVKFPFPNLNVVPIPSRELVESKFKELSKISYVSFKIFNENGKMEFNPLFQGMKDFMNNSESTSIDAILSSPKNIETIEDAVKESEGKSQFNLKGRTKENDKVTISAEDVSEIIPLEISTELSIVESSKFVYNKLKDRKEISFADEDNQSTYKRHKDNIISFEVLQQLKRK